MDVAGKVVVVTGGGSGIGAALCRRFVAEGAAKVVVVDLDETHARAVADGPDLLAYGCDVASEEALVAMIDDVEARTGPIALFCSNAGLCVPDPDPDNPTSSDNRMWQRNWDVHVMAHVYAARALVPRMAGRGGGWFLNTISAAGLLAQLGNGPYSATKHAAVGFAETLSIQCADKGIGVSILCPQAVRTPMIRGAEEAAASVNGIISPEVVADCVVEALAAKKFLILPHPQVSEYVQRKGQDYDRWLSGMRRLHRASFAV